jgi:DNA-binding winged helix-turn-helix (wHTH) protein
MIFSFDDYVLDTSMFELRYRGETVPLQPKPLDILHYLLVHRDRVVLKSELFSHLWPGVHVTENALAQAIACVREALGQARGAAVVSVRGRGYRFALPVLEHVPKGRARLGGSLAGHEGGFVADAAEVADLEDALAGVDALVVRVVARSSGPLASFRALVAAYLERAPDPANAAALAGAADTHALADVATAILSAEPSRPVAFVLEHLERADLESVLLFTVLAQARRAGVALAGTCAWSELGEGSAVRRLLEPLAFPPRTRQRRLTRTSGAAPRYFGMRPMMPLPESAK